jgi:hypothetical protein
VPTNQHRHQPRGGPRERWEQRERRPKHTPEWPGQGSFLEASESNQLLVCPQVYICAEVRREVCQVHRLGSGREGNF